MTAYVPLENIRPYGPAPGDGAQPSEPPAWAGQVEQWIAEACHELVIDPARISVEWYAGTIFAGYVLPGRPEGLISIAADQPADAGRESIRHEIAHLRGFPEPACWHFGRGVKPLVVGGELRLPIGETLEGWPGGAT